MLFVLGEYEAPLFLHILIWKKLAMSLSQTEHERPGSDLQTDRCSSEYTVDRLNQRVYECHLLVDTLEEHGCTDDGDEDEYAILCTTQVALDCTRYAMQEFTAHCNTMTPGSVPTIVSASKVDLEHFAEIGLLLERAIWVVRVLIEVTDVQTMWVLFSELRTLCFWAWMHECYQKRDFYAIVRAIHVCRDAQDANGVRNPVVSDWCEPLEQECRDSMHGEYIATDVDDMFMEGQRPVPCVYPLVDDTQDIVIENTEDRMDVLTSSIEELDIDTEEDRVSKCHIC